MSRVGSGRELGGVAEEMVGWQRSFWGSQQPDNPSRGGPTFLLIKGEAVLLEDHKAMRRKAANASGVIVPPTEVEEVKQERPGVEAGNKISWDTLQAIQVSMNSFHSS